MSSEGASEAAFEISGLCHRYPTAPNGVWAVRDLSLAASQGTVLGLLGPNGAGKTTVVKVLATLLLPTHGRASVGGYDVTKNLEKVRREIGLVLGGERGLYDRLSAQDNLRYFAELYGLGGRSGRMRIDEVLELVGLQHDRGKKVEAFSRGMKQRLHIARGILHRPSVLLLDEPTIGVDPVGARALRTLIRQLMGRGTTILLTTHYMHEAEELADKVAILRDGLLTTIGTPAEIRQSATVQAVIECAVSAVSEDQISDLAAIPSVTGVDAFVHAGRQRLLIGTSEIKPSEQLLARLEQEIGASERRIREATLEDAYVEFVTGDGAVSAT